MSLPKLVRDRIPEIIKHNNGKTPITRILNEEEYEQRLLDKLIEEAQEVKGANQGEERVEELADIMEIVKAIAELEGKTLEDIEEIRKSKADERGGFEKRILLESME